MVVLRLDSRSCSRAPTFAKFPWSPRYVHLWWAPPGIDKQKITAAPLVENTEPRLETCDGTLREVVVSRPAGPNSFAATADGNSKWHPPEPVGTGWWDGLSCNFATAMTYMMSCDYYSYCITVVWSMMIMIVMDHCYQWSFNYHIHTITYHSYRQLLVFNYHGWLFLFSYTFTSHVWPLKSRQETPRILPTRLRIWFAHNLSTARAAPKGTRGNWTGFDGENHTEAGLFLWTSSSAAWTEHVQKLYAHCICHAWEF